MSFIYILVDIDLNVVNAAMHTDNLAPPADALQHHREREAASKVTDKSVTSEHINTFFAPLTHTHTHTSGYTVIQETLKERPVGNLLAKWRLKARNARKTHDKCDCRSLGSMYTQLHLQ